MNFGKVPILSHQGAGHAEERLYDWRFRTPRGLREYRAEQHRRNNQAYAVTQALGETPQIERVVTKYVAQRKRSVLKWPRR